MAAKISAGLLLFREPAAPQLLLVHPGGPFWARKDLGAWSIPKGEPEPGEELFDCALRELGEELGPGAPALVGEELTELGSIRQKSGKTVYAWAAQADFDPAALASNLFELEWPPRSGERREFPEADRAEWFGPDEARRKILPAQAPLIDRLLESPLVYSRR
ncbi:MAG TPA: NUDIX domain-containing protein [Solirubrobacterales bacterium]|nr:NUDIX domain-containing protein [Solirubrobacterales bacterium]